MTIADWLKIILPALLTWAGAVTYWSLSGSSLAEVEAVLHRRISGTKAELVEERREDIRRLEKEIDRLWQVILKGECPEEGEDVDEIQGVS